MHLRTSLDPVSKYDVTIGNHVANWKLGQDKTRLSTHRISRLDKTVSKFSVADRVDLSPIQFTSRTPTRQDCSKKFEFDNVGTSNVFHRFEIHGCFKRHAVECKFVENLFYD